MVHYFIRWLHSVLHSCIEASDPQLLLAQVDTNWMPPNHYSSPHWPLQTPPVDYQETGKLPWVEMEWAVAFTCLFSSSYWRQAWTFMQGQSFLGFLPCGCQVQLPANLSPRYSALITCPRFWRTTLNMFVAVNELFLILFLIIYLFLFVCFGFFCFTLTSSKLTVFWF